MAFSNLQVSTGSFTGDGVYNLTHDTQGPATFVMVQYVVDSLGYCSGTVDGDSPSNSLRAAHNYFTYGHKAVGHMAWVDNNGIRNGVLDIPLTVSGGSATGCYIITSGYTSGLSAYAYSDSLESTNGAPSYSYDSSPDEGMAFYGHQHATHTIGGANGTTECKVTSPNAGLYSANAGSTGTHSAGSGTTTSSASTFAVITEQELQMQATSHGLLVTVATPGVAGPGDIFGWPPSVGLLVRVSPAVATVSARQVVPLVGEHTEMPGRVPYPDGLTNPVMTLVDGEYVWIDGSSLVPARSRLVPLTTTGTSGDPELVWDADDQLVMTEYYE